MNAWAYVAYAALAVTLAAPAIWSAGHRAGRADEAEALLSIDFDVRGPL